MSNTQPPYGQPSQFGMGNQPNPGSKKSKAGLIAAIVALVVVVAAVIVALVFTLNSDDDDDNAKGTDTESSQSTSSDPSGEPSNPTSSPSSEPSDGSSNTTSEPVDPDTDDSTIQGDGYTYELPDGWSDQASSLDAQSAPESIDTVSSWGEALDGGRANVIVETGPANGQTNLTSLKPSWVANLTGSERKATDIDPITIDGYDAIGVRMDSVNKRGVKIVQFAYLTVVNDKIYSVGLSTTPADVSEARATFRDILGTWTWS